MEDITDKHIQACVDKDGKITCIYFPSGGEETIDLSRLKTDNLFMWWFNPRDGKCYSQENAISEEAISLAKALKIDEKGNVIKIVTPTHGNEQEWVCVIEYQSNATNIPGNPQRYGDMPIPPEVKKVFPTW